MKNKIKILLILAIGVLLLPTCQKDPDLRIPELQIGVIPLIEKDTDLDQNLDFQSLSSFTASLSVDVYYEELPRSMRIVIAMNDDFENRAILKDNITTFPTEISLNANDLVTLLPGLDSIQQLELGDYFRVYAVTTLKDGTVIDGMDTLYAAYGNAIPNLPGSSVEVVFTVVCPFDAAKTAGSYYSFSAPDQWNSAGNITITADPENPYTVYVFGMADIEGLDEDGDLIPMHINPLTYEVTVDPTVIASDYFGYTNGTFAGSGVYNSCTGEYIMDFDISVVEGSFGAYTFVLTPND